MTSPSPRDLRRDVLAIAGIADAEVDHRDSTPVVRVWLDGSREADEVAAQIRKLLARKERPPVTAPAARTAKRSGLGRGLESLIPPPLDESPPPAHLRPLRDAADPIQLEVVAVVERSGGVTVRAEDTAGRSAEIAAHNRDYDAAIAAAVAQIVGVAPPRIVTVATQDIAGAEVVTVVLDLAAGGQRVGSAIAGAGRPFTLGCAVWAALHHGGDDG